MKKLVIASLAGFLTISAAACGGESNSSLPTSPSPSGNPAPAPAPNPNPNPNPSPSPSPSPSPDPTPAPAPAAFTQTLTGTVGTEDGTAGGPEKWVVYHDMAAPRGGTATLTLTWSKASVDLDLVLTPTACNYPYLTCPQIAASENLHGTTEKITQTVQEGQTYRIWVSNFGYESLDYRIDIEIK
jgi:hypothetical protein